MEVDYIIVGQGISGSFLSWNLINAGMKVMVIDDAHPFSASKVASGVINPVTGRRIVTTWMIDQLLPFALDAYTAFGNQMGVDLIQQKNILDFHPTPQMKLAFEDRQPEASVYLRVPENETSYSALFNYYFGVGEIHPCYLIDVQCLIDNWRIELKKMNALIEARFTLEGNEPVYKDIKAKKIIFCDGCNGFDNPYFKLLPYAKNKGEAIIVSIDGLPRTHIYKQGLTLVPWKENLWWVGSTYEWNFTDLNPSPSFRLKVEQQLNQWLKMPYTIVDHLASERPANMERRPFVGLHPIHKQFGIFNGMGTKGCSLAPFFAKQFTDFLVEGTPILPLADVARFQKVLSR